MKITHFSSCPLKQGLWDQPLEISNSQKNKNNEHMQCLQLLPLVFQILSPVSYFPHMSRQPTTLGQIVNVIVMNCKSSMGHYFRTG